MASLVDFYKSKLAGVGQKLTNILDRDKETPGFQITKNPVLFSRSTAEGGYKPSLALQAAGGLQNFAENKLTNIPKFTPLSSRVEKIKNPVTRFIAGVPAGFVEGVANIPGDLLSGSALVGREIGKGFDPTRNIDASQLIKGGARLGESFLNATTLGVGKQLAEQAGKQTLKSVLKEGAKSGAKYGAAYGALGGLQDTSGGVKGQLLGAGTGAVTGAAMGAAGGAVLGGGMYGIGRGVEAIAARRAAANAARNKLIDEMPRLIKPEPNWERKVNLYYQEHGEPIFNVKKDLSLQDVNKIYELKNKPNLSGVDAQEIKNIFTKRLDSSNRDTFTPEFMLKELSLHADNTGIKPGFARLDLGVGKETPKLSVEPMTEAQKFDLNFEAEREYGRSKDKLIALIGKVKEGNYKSDADIPKPLLKQLKDAQAEMNLKFDEWKNINNTPTIGVPTGNRTQISSLEGNGSNPLTYKDKSIIQPLSVEPVGGKPVAQGGVENVGGYKKLGDWRELPLPDGFENQYKNIKTGEVKHISELPKNIQSKLGVAQGGLSDVVLNDLNPTGSVMAKYDAQTRATAKLGPDITTLDKTMGKSPNETVTIYRGVSSGHNEINPGDFITTNKQLAQDYAGNGKVISKEVKLSDILDSKTESLGEEYIYRPSLSPSKGGVGDVTRVEPKIVKPLKEVYKEKLAGQIDQKPIVQRPTGQLATQIPSELSLRQPSLPSQTTQSLLRTTQPPQPPQPPKLQMGSQQMSGTPEAKIDQWKYSSLDKLYTEGIDRFNPLSKIAKLAGKDKDMARQLARYYGTGSIADYHLTEELSPILRSVDINDLKKSAIAMRDVELASRGVKGSPEQMKAQFNLQDLTNKLGSEKMAQIGDALKKLYAYQDSMVKQYLVDTGIMSRESYDAMRKNNQFYVPFKRVMDDVDEMLGIPVKRGAGSVGSQNVIFGIKGSNKDIVDPIQSIVENTYKLVSLGERQKTARVIVNLGEQLPGLVKRVTTGDQKNTIGLFENGEKVFYEVPEEVADAARGMSEESLNTLIKILKLPTDVFRTMTTGANPEFLMPNVARDLQTAFFNAGVNPLEWIAGIAHYVKGDQVYKDFLRSGGRTSIISANKKAIIRTAEDLASKGSFTIKSPADLWKGFEILGQFSEQPTRIASFKKIYDKAIKSGLSPEEALQDAAIAAQDTTINFARRGSKTQSINAVYAYLNARMQGVDKMFRTIKNEPGKAAARFGIGLLAPSLALYAWNNRFQSYYDPSVVSDRDKTDNFIFMLSDKRGGMQYLKIPKAEVGKIVNPVEEFLDFARGKDANMANSIKSLLTSFLPVDYIGGLVPTAIQPPLENAINKDLYTGYDLVPQYKQNYPKGYQDSPYTSPVYRMIGQKTGQSPAKLQNLVEGYLGGMSKGAEMITRPIVPQKYVSPKNEQGADINKTFILRRFAGGEKKSAEEQIKSNQSKKDAIESQINVIRKQKMLGNFDASVADKEIAKLERQLPKIVTTISGKSNYYYIDSNQDMKTVDIGKVTSMPSSTNYERALKETEKWKLVDDVLNLDPQDQASALKDLGVTKEDAAYYKVASADSSAKYAYVKDQAQGASNYQEFLTKTLPLFKEVNGKKVFTDTVVDQLYDEGIITSAQKKQLKSIDYSGAKPKLKSGTTKAKYVKAVLPKSTLSSLPKVKRIRTKRYKLVVPKAK